MNEVRESAPRRWPACLVVIGSLAWPALALEVRGAHDAAFDFGPLQTFAWMSSEKLPGRALPENDAIIREEVVAALTARGYGPAEEPDFLVIYYVGLQDQVSVRRESSGDTHVTPYEEGTLILEFYAPGQDRPIWRGEAEDALDRQRVRRQVRKIVGKMLKGFPPS